MRLQRSILGLVFCLSIVGCPPPEANEYLKAKDAASLGHHRTALSGFDRVLKRAPESDYALKAAREGARIAVLELKDYKRAVTYHKFLVLHANDPHERVSSQKQLASIYFDQLQNYDQAILELNKLVTESETDVEIARYKLDIARANYYQNNFFQSQSELDDLLKRNVDDNERFAALVLKSNIYMAQKKYTDAIEIFKKLIPAYPEKSLLENIYQTIAVCYEESGNFTEAIKMLEIAKDKNSQPEYTELRIKRLKERQKNQPGARGLRK